MDILVLTDRMRYPVEDGQSLRIFHYARHLGATHRFSLVTFGAPPYAEPLRELFAEIRTVPRRSIDRQPLSVGKIVRAFRVDDYLEHDHAMAALIQRAVAETRPDAIWISGWDMATYLPLLEGQATVADIVDEGFLEHGRELLRLRSLAALPARFKDLVMSVRWERAFCRRARVAAVVSDVDARWLRRFVGTTPVAVLENGVDQDYFRPLGEPEDHPTIVFEGHLKFAPNVDAALWLATGILPLVRAAIPEARLILVGREPVPAIQRLQGDAVTVTGRVADVRPYLDRGSVFACPMRKGAGIKNKLLQAWSMEKAVVATPLACGGLRVRPDDNIVVAGSTRAFAAQLVRLLRDAPLRRRLGVRARQTVLGYYTWRQRASALEAAFHRAASIRHSAPALVER